MLKAAIVGCGKIADAHAWAIQRVKGSRIVGVCDAEELMARQLAERFAVKHCFTDIAELIAETRPDVVHITTPPLSHFQISRLCLESGCHIYVEKPFTLHTSRAEELFSLAEQRGLKITVGHDEQFSHAARRMRALVRDGYLGGRPVHMESTWCYDLGDPNYARAMLGDQHHWVRKLPGKLLHNLISHGVAKIAEFLTADMPCVSTVGFASGFLQRLNETDIVDELRVIVTGDQKTTAYFTFSSQMRPALNQFCVFGPENGLLLDEDRQTLIKLRGKKYKSYLERFVPPLTCAGQYLSNFFENVRLFGVRDFHMNAGKRYLVESFYRSITEQSPVPIPPREILLTSRIMDGIFEGISASSTPGNLSNPRNGALVDSIASRY